MKTIVYSVLAAGLTVFAAVPAALADLDEETQSRAVDACTNGTGGTQAAIDGCTTLIDNLEMSPAVEVTLRYFRGSYMVELGQNEGAVTDLGTAIGVYDGAADKGDWRPEAVEKVTGSYYWRGRAHEALNQCDEAKADYQRAADMATDVSDRRGYQERARSVCKS